MESEFNSPESDVTPGMPPENCSGFSKGLERERQREIWSVESPMTITALFVFKFPLIFFGG